MNKWKILFIGLLSTWADAATSLIASRIPELVETRPLANPFLETVVVLGTQTFILYGGEAWKLNPKITVAIALAPAAVPFFATANNLVHLALIQAKTYPWKECPLLYNGK